MKKETQFKGQLKNYMFWPLMLTALIVLLNVPLYYIDKKAGICVSVFAACYFVIVLTVYLLNRSAIRSEVISFATQYGTVQKKLLDEFKIPYALLDYNSKILWMNKAFSAITEREKRYHKSITTIFPSITREILEKEDQLSNVQVEWKDKLYRICVDKLYFDEGEPESSLIELDTKDQYLMALYLFDETELHHYISENKELQLVSALIYKIGRAHV